MSLRAHYRIIHPPSLSMIPATDARAASVSLEKDFQFQTTTSMDKHYFLGLRTGYQAGLIFVVIHRGHRKTLH